MESEHNTARGADNVWRTATFVVKNIDELLKKAY